MKHGEKKRSVRPDREGNERTTASVANRLLRIEGQVRGIQRMVEEERYCMDVLTQISAIHESLRKVSEVLLRDHLSHCVSFAVQSGDSKKADEIYDELVDLFNKYAR